MFSSDDISLIKTTALETVIRREFGADADAKEVELEFTEFVTSGPGAYEDYSSWRQAWRDFVEFSREADEDVHAVEATDTVIGTLAIGVPVGVLKAEHQISLF